MKQRFILLLAIATVLFSSCSSTKKILYLQDMNIGEHYPMTDRYEAVVQSGDRLDITVSAKNPELAIPFNVADGSVYTTEEGDVKATNQATTKKGYRVDKDGNIEFPVLGKLHVEGLTLRKTSELVKEQLIAGNYIKSPLVTAEFLNFKFYVLGELGTGSYSVDGDGLNLLEAIAMAGDLADNARLDRIGVLREEGGTRVLYMNNIKSKDIFDSPCFYLHQNDIIYVQPKRKATSESKFLQYFTVLISLITATCSVIWLTR